MSLDLVTDSPSRRRTTARQRRQNKIGCDGARIAVMSSGLSREVIEDVESRRAVDWRMLAGALDGLYMAAGGSLGVKRVMTTPATALDGRTPIESLSDMNGPEQVALYLCGEARRVALSRV